MRIGLFGGTFDPPHIGHLLVAGDAAEALGLDRVVFVPAAEQPFKVGATVAPAGDRLAMTERLVGDDPRFAVDAVEIERGGLSYTVDTVRTLRGRWLAEEGELVLYLLVGADAAAALPQWREYEVLRTLAEIRILTRGAAEGVGTGAVPSTEGGDGMLTVATRRVDVSSTEIRARVRAGHSIRGFVPDAVARYIADRRLYR